MNLLEQIVEDTSGLVSRRRRERTLRDLEDQPLFERSPLSLAEALRTDELAFIAEIKKASPSKGVIRANLDVEKVAAGYEAAGAAAISVLTEPFYFQGTLDNLALARGVAEVPLLRKDFIIDPYQLFEARAYGADAVLLIATVLDRYQLEDLHQAAEALGLSALVELYDLAELERVDLDRVRVLGVNNRDLRTFEVDIDHSLRVFKHVPAHVVRVSESGLREVRDLAHLRENEIDAVLVGETFMRAESPEQALRDLRDELAEMLDRRAQ